MSTTMDIVIRLRKETSPLMHDAAREIERLLAALKEITRMPGWAAAEIARNALSNEQDGK
jgi:hypothetical protein